MVNQQLLDYIKSVRNKGYSDEQIKEHLIKHNYSRDLVEEAFLLTDNMQNNSNQDLEAVKPMEVNKKPTRKKNNSLILLIIGFFIIILGIAGFLIFQSTRYIGCEDVSLAVHKISNEDVLCVFPDNSKIMTIIKNTGQQNIKNLIFKIKGTGITIEKLENVNIKPGDISTHTISYGKSSINEIKIIPETDKKICRPVVYTEIKTC